MGSLVDDEVLTQPISTISPLLATKDISPVELTEATLARVERLNPETSCYISVQAEDAVAAARTAANEIARGNYRGPLHGIPFGAKDNLAVSGVATTAGSSILADNVSKADAAVIEGCRKAGAVLIGKHNLHEFAAGVTNANPHYGRVPNPWHDGHIPGGSSGGTAAAVALGLGYFGLGSDGSGSVRIPAALCGLVGYKASYGAISRRGMVPPVYPGWDHGPGVLARSVADARMVAAAIAGYDPRDGACRTTPLNVGDQYNEQADGRQVVVGRPTAYFWDGLEGDAAVAMQNALAALERLGVEIRDVEVPYVHAATASYRGWRREIEFHREMLRERRDAYGEDVRLTFLAQEFVLARDRVRAEFIQQRFRREMAAVMEQVDFLVTPTTPGCAPTWPSLEAATDDVEEGVRQTNDFVLFTQPINTAWLPAVTLPCPDVGALPFGVQLVGGYWKDAHLLAFADRYFSDVFGTTVPLPPKPTPESVR